MGGQVGVADHLRIGSHAAIGAKSGLMHDVTPGTRMFGIPARPARDEMQIQALQGKLPEMRKAVRELQRQIAELSRELPASSGLKVTDRDAA
jgi:UDP-3-O-[3-hydroxymyristoyl] glucosamine N-acyltransferase